MSTPKMPKKKFSSFCKIFTPEVALSIINIVKHILSKNWEEIKIDPICKNLFLFRRMWNIPGTETWSSIDEEFLTITCCVRLAPLIVGLCDTSLGTFSETFFTSGSSTGDRTKKFSRSQITERETSCNVDVDEAFDEAFPVALAGKDFNKSLLSSSIGWKKKV